nr:putative integron gene cassette protein [uncultured bacterium]
MAMANLSNHDMKERDKYLPKARLAESFLDAVFFIYYFNNNKNRFCNGSNIENIEPGEVFSEFEDNAYSNALLRCADLLSKTSYVGGAFYNYVGSVPYNEALRRMHSEHPGFSDVVYGIVCSSSTMSMR